MVGKCRATKLNPQPVPCHRTASPGPGDVSDCVSNRTTSTSVQGTLVLFFSEFALIILSIFKDLSFIMGEYYRRCPLRLEVLGDPSPPKLEFQLVVSLPVLVVGIERESFCKESAGS